MTGKELRAQMELLDDSGFLQARTAIARLLDMDDRERTLMRIRTEAAYGAHASKLRGLWTAYCFTAGLVPGTPDYEKKLTLLERDAENGLDRAYMSQYMKEAYGQKGA